MSFDVKHPELVQYPLDHVCMTTLKIESLHQVHTDFLAWEALSVSLQSEGQEQQCAMKAEEGLQQQDRSESEDVRILGYPG